jgi:membrane-bound inhibitor of C-type lysozyme
MATIDVKNAYLNASLEDEGLVIVLDSVVTKEYIKLRPEAADFVNGKGELYCKLNRALYGTVEGAKAWYNDLSSFLISIGFASNSYDNCVFNKMVKGVQITIGVYVDDLLISCKDKKMITEFKEALERKYEEVSFDESVKLSYLGMVIDNSNSKFIKLSMPSYIEQVIKETDIGNGIAATPAALDLFDIDDDSPLLSGDSKEAFHTSVAKLLYLSKRARPDILLPVTFLCTRVQYPTEQDLKKLKRVIKYLNGTKGLIMKIQKTGDVSHVNVFCDASFAVHKNMRSHTGAIISVGNTAVFYKCNKQKLNTKSSTEAELVALSDVLPQAINTSNFIAEQIGGKVIPTFHEDNKSTISMVKNGKALAESTRHINIRYFLISDYLEQGLIDIQYVNTKDQVGDYYTKPLQGEDFLRHRNYILGHTDHDGDKI